VYYCKLSSVSITKTKIKNFTYTHILTLENLSMRLFHGVCISQACEPHNVRGALHKTGTPDTTFSLEAHHSNIHKSNGVKKWVENSLLPDISI